MYLWLDYQWNLYGTYAIKISIQNQLIKKKLRYETWNEITDIYDMLAIH